MEWAAYIPVVLVALALLASAVYALSWAVKHRQFQQLEQGATVIFDDEEPMGRTTDHFPGHAPTGATPSGAAQSTKNPR